MRCVFCGRDPNPVVLVPLQDAEGRLEQFACVTCAAEHGLYCSKHDRPHLGFQDGTHACVECVEEDAASHEALGAVLNVRINVEFPLPEVERIDEYLDEAGYVTGGRTDRDLARIVALIAPAVGSYV